MQETPQGTVNQVQCPQFAYFIEFYLSFVIHYHEEELSER